MKYIKKIKCFKTRCWNKEKFWSASWSKGHIQSIISSSKQSTYFSSSFSWIRGLEMPIPLWGQLIEKYK